MKLPPTEKSLIYYAVVGGDVSRSKSPAVHNAAFVALELPGRFTAVSTDDPLAVVNQARQEGWGGLAVTIPHKRIVITLLDEVDDDAASLGAVNTITFCDGRAFGANTDVTGILASFAEQGVVLSGKRVCVVGAGGAARAAVGAALHENAAEVVVLNRTPVRARQLAADFAPHAVVGGPLDESSRSMLGNADVVIQTTPVGARAGETPVLPGWLRPGVALLDVIYQPLPTLLMQAVRNAGGIAIGGDRMFIHQAAAQCRLWTGREAPLAAMEHAFYLGEEK
jgi:shikimate dehydrogenase